MKILVPVDGSSFTKRMLAYLAVHDEWLGAQHDYTVLHVAVPVPRGAARVLERALIQGHYDEQAEKVFKPIRSFFGKRGLQARYVAKVGAPGDIIPALATQGGFDLVVLGSHGHGSLVNLVLGSVATKVIASCSTPVLLIR